MPVCYQVNLQTSPGGGEIFTRFFTEALASIGWETVLVVARPARFWEAMRLPATLVAIDEGHQLTQVLPAGSTVLSQNVLGAEIAREISATRCLAGIVHMPFQGREPAGLPWYKRVFAVSRHVLDSLEPLGVAVHAQPLYGVADLKPRDFNQAGPIRSGPLYDWDRRKVRDRLLAALPFKRGGLAFSRRPGITLGVVSRLTPIKQFPLMFSILAPILARRDGLNLEIFGSGGYASVRDLRRSLAPLGARARFWGQQSDVAQVYGQLDYVLSGLPEKEALGLNLVEAQACGIPVLAVNAPPFTETVLDGVTGHLFTDPREDGAKSFTELLDRICSGTAGLDRSKADAHLEKFSREAFRARVAQAMTPLSARPLT